MRAYRYKMRMTTPVACDESLMRVRYGPEGTADNASAPAADAAGSDPASSGGTATTSDTDTASKGKQEL